MDMHAFDVPHARPANNVPLVLLDCIPALESPANTTCCNSMSMERDRAHSTIIGLATMLERDRRFAESLLSQSWHLG
jgi:hypothetical protein